jgi:hypothetical protein
MAQAVELYNSQSTQNSGGKPLSLWAVCEKVSNDYFARTKQCIPLDYKTLSWLSKGGITLTESNGKKRMRDQI